MAVEITLTNWQCHKELNFTAWHHVDLVLAANMQGKTAIRDAFEFAIAGTGHLRGIATKKDLALLSIHEDEAKCSVELTFHDAEGKKRLYVFRSMERDGSQSLMIGDQSGIAETKKLTKAQAILWQLLGDMTDSQLFAALGSEALFVLSPKDRRTLVASALEGLAIEEAEVVDRLERRGIDPADCDEFAKLVLRDGWRVAEDTAGRRRADAKAAIKAMGEKPKPVPMYRPKWSKNVVNLAQVTEAKMVERISAYRDTLGKAKEATAASKGALEAALDMLEAQHRDTAQELATLGEDQPDVGALETAVNEWQRKEQGSVAVRNEWQREVDKLRAESTVDVGDLIRPDPCPVIPGGPKCPMTEAKMAKHAEKMVGARQALLNEVGEAEQRLGVAEEEALSIMAERVEAEERLRSGREVRDRMAHLESELSRLDGEIESKAAMLADAKTAPAGDSDFLEKRIEQGEIMLDVKRKYDNEMARAMTYDETFEKLERAQHRWDTIAKALKPDAVEAEFTDRALAPMREAIEIFGKRFGGMRLDGEYNVELQWEGRWRRYQQLSESGRLRIGWAVQYAFAKLTGFPVLVIDQIDHLDGPAKRQAIETLRDVAPDFHAVIGLATLQRGKAAPTPFEDVGSWLLTDGGIQGVK